MRRGSTLFVCSLLLAAAQALPAHALPAGLAEPAKESCTSCHAEANASKLRLPVELVTSRQDVHAAAGLGCSACHGGDATATGAAKAHGAGFVSASTSDAAVAACGKCHAGPAQNFAKGPHHLARDAARRPNCVTCHGAHGVKPASLDLIAEPLCSSCHGIAQARRIQKALGDAEGAVTSLDAELARTGNSKAERAKLREARTQMRGVTHSLDLLTITRQAAVALSTADEVRAKALPHVAARDWGKVLQIAGLVAAGLMLLLGAAAGVRFVWARRHHVPVLGKLSGGALKWVGAAAAVLVIAGAVAAWRGNHYIAHDPKFCLSCHTMNSAFDLWQQSGHKNVECHSCHVPNLAANVHQLYQYATKRPDMVVKHAEINRAICESCHASGQGPAKKNRVVETAGHQVHAGKARIECVQCHGESVHKFRPPKEICANCHKQVTMTAAGTMAEMHCLQCHSFLATQPDPKKVSLKPDRVLCLDCHQQRQVKNEVFPTGKAPMTWECGKCHKPHAKMAIGNADCVKCHNTVNEGLHKVSAHANDCQSCHKPHTWTAGAATCQKCHARIDPALHHPEKKSCVECHGAWDDSWVKIGPTKTAAKKPAGK